MCSYFTIHSRVIQYNKRSDDEPIWTDIRTLDAIDLISRVTFPPLSARAVCMNELSSLILEGMMTVLDFSTSHFQRASRDMKMDIQEQLCNLSFSIKLAMNNGYLSMMIFAVERRHPVTQDIQHGIVQYQLF